MLYDSSRNVKREAFANYILPPAGDRKRWQGIPHQHLVTQILREAQKRGLFVLDQQYQLSNNGHGLYASWDFDQAVPGVKGVRLCMGYRGDNVSEKAHTICVGGRVFICQNGIISAEHVLRRRHTHNCDLKGLVNDAFDMYLAKINGIGKMIEVLRSLTLTDRMADSIMLDSARTGIVAWSRLQSVNDEWYEPSHREFTPRNAWSMYNAYTDVAKKCPPKQQMTIMRKMPRFLKNFVETA